MFYLWGMKLAAKPRGWLGYSDVSSQAGSRGFLLPTTKMLILPASAETCLAQGEPPSFLQLTYLTQRQHL